MPFATNDIYFLVTSKYALLVFKLPNGLLYHIEKDQSSKTKNNVKNTEGHDESQIY